MSFGSFVLSLADVDPHLMMEDESLVWTSKDVVVVYLSIKPKKNTFKMRKTALYHGFKLLVWLNIVFATNLMYSKSKSSLQIPNSQLPGGYGQV